MDKFNGDVSVWYNRGVKNESDRDRLGGSIIEWSRQGKLYNGVDRGPNEYFMDYGKPHKSFDAVVSSYIADGGAYLNNANPRHILTILIESSR